LVPESMLCADTKRPVSFERVNSSGSAPTLSIKFFFLDKRYLILYNKYSI
jgi:hypothetical protein